jgi:hypothetical protein
MLWNTMPSKTLLLAAVLAAALGLQATAAAEEVALSECAGCLLPNPPSIPPSCTTQVVCIQEIGVPTLVSMGSSDEGAGELTCSNCNWDGCPNNPPGFATVLTCELNTQHCLTTTITTLVSGEWGTKLPLALAKFKTEVGLDSEDKTCVGISCTAEAEPCVEVTLAYTAVVNDDSTWEVRMVTYGRLKVTGGPLPECAPANYDGSVCKEALVEYTADLLSGSFTCTSQGELCDSSQSQ